MHKRMPDAQTSALRSMAFKVKEVLALLCILLPCLSIAIIISMSPLLQKRIYHTIKQKGINDSFKLRLDTLQSYDMVIESSPADSSVKSLTRRELVGMPPDTAGLLLIPHEVHLRSHYLAMGSDDLVSTSSFAVSFTMSLYQPPPPPSTTTTRPLNAAAGLDFLVLPSLDASGSSRELTTQLVGAPGARTLSNDSTAGAARFPGGANVSVEIGRLLLHDDLLVARVTITEPAPAARHTWASASATTYTVWIEYAHLWQCLSVYVAAAGDEGKAAESSRPDEAVAIRRNVSYSDASYGTASFGLVSSVGQLMRINSWSTEAEANPYQLISLLTDSVKNFAVVYVSLNILLGAVGVVAAAAMAGLGVARYFRAQQRRWKEEHDKLAMIMQSLPGVPTQVDFADISRATANFHETMKLGKGGFSSVYRCRLLLPAAAGTASAGSSGRSTTATEVAIKKFTRGVQEQRYEDFLAEVSIINRLRHKNVVPLVGWSYNKGEPLLIYEYMTNGSLDQHLFQGGGNGEHQQEQGHLRQEDDTSIRQWGTRYRIARDIATGLHYVHHEHEPVVLHRDIKASNVMLDSNFRARLGDFGIACTVAADRSSVTGVGGTWGYIAPDYAMSHRATRQADIYAFGVLILELVTGRKTREVPPDDGHISDWVWRLHGEGEGKLLEAVDDHQHAVILEEAERLLLLGLACTNPNPSDRPSMAEAVQVISKLAPPPNVPPERPAFVWPPKEWRSLDSDYCTTTDETNLDGISVISRVELEELVQTALDQPPQESTTFFSV